MATITFGGGPSLEARKDFSNLRDGTQVPGYRGYIPKIKYAIGKTYGTDTHQLAQRGDFHPLSAPVTHGSRPPLRNEIPDPYGDNKLMKDMVPGYSGYIPRGPFKFGDTYKIGCDYCIDEHITNVNKRHAHERDLYKGVNTPRLAPLVQDPEVRDHLDTYRDNHPQRRVTMVDKRAPTEAPMPGYQGYVPRIGQTELGLGCRYATSSKQGFEAFYTHPTRSHTVSIDRSPTEYTLRNTYSKRLFMPEGVIPRYTGYLPQRRFQFGATYGNTTRSLDVCAHEKDCFGDFVKTKPKITASFVC